MPPFGEETPYNKKGGGPAAMGYLLRWGMPLSCMMGVWSVKSFDKGGSRPWLGFDTSFNTSSSASGISAEATTTWNIFNSILYRPHLSTFIICNDVNLT